MRRRAGGARRGREHPVDVYARDVVSGAVVAGPLVRLACERHLRDRRRSVTRAWPWTFRPDVADAVLRFFERVLRLPDTVGPDGEPLPFRLEPWQQFIIGSLFSWVDRFGHRRYREAYIEIGKGNGKTPMAAGIGLFGLLLDGKPAAEIYAAATTRDQAMILWRDARRMVECSPELRAQVHVSVGNLAYAPTYSFFRPISSEHRQLDGKRPHMALLDELHEHANAYVAHKLRAGAKGDPNFLALEITNAGVDRASICWEHHEHSRRVLEGGIEDARWFAYVCGLDADDDPLTDASCWIKANPNLGVSIQRSYLERQVENARHLPGETNTVLRLNFCVWTQAHTRAIDLGRWMEAPEVPASAWRGRPVYGGLDLGMTDDFAAWVMICPQPDGVIAVRSRFWLPSRALERFRDRPYAAWQREGALIVTPGDATDFDRIEQTILEDAREWGVQEIAYDKRFALQLALHLEGHGIRMIDTPQGYGLTESVRRWQALVADRQLAHGHHPILTWMADHVMLQEGRLGEVRLDKQRSRDKIDGIVALVMALSRLLATPPPPKPSIYESRGLLTIGGRG